MTYFSEVTLRQLWPRGDSKIPGLIAGTVAAQQKVFNKYGIDSDEVVAQLMAQFSHECGAGTEMVENVNYSAERAAEVWPLHSNDKNAYRHFSSAADCYAKCKSSPGDPQFHRKLINLVYGTRMGNRPGTDDGWMYIGRGFPQTTGHDGYAALEKETGLPVLAHPELVSDPANALLCGVADFVLCGCLPYARKGDVVGVSAMLNVGHIVQSSAIVGLDERRNWLTRWRTALKTQTPVVTPPSAQEEVVHDAFWVQRSLNTLGFGPLVPDGKIGPKSQAAILRFQAARGLPKDPTASPQTIAAIATSLAREGG